MPAFVDKLKDKPWVAHLLRAVERFGNRLGSQFAAAITYFSILALVPILLLAFAILGFVLTVLRPDLIGDVSDSGLTDALGSTDPDTQAKISGLVADYLNNWKGVGIVALLSALYSGAGWMGNLKNAVRAQWRPDFDLQEAQGNIVKKTAGQPGHPARADRADRDHLRPGLAVDRADRHGARRARAEPHRLAAAGAALRADRLLDRRRLVAVHVPLHRAARGPRALAGGPARRADRRRRPRRAAVRRPGCSSRPSRATRRPSCSAR